MRIVNYGNPLADLLCDVHHGRVWKQFLNHDGVPFLSEKHNLALSLNVDWFQPFSLSPGSVGAMYMTIMNLPRNFRFKREYVMLVGIIPGPSEPKITINSYLEPLVKELCLLWEEGLTLKIHSVSELQKVRCALLCVACDLPASRKVCGFLGHSANLGCSKCYKFFPGTFGKKDYSGFKREEWEKRTNEVHRIHSDLILACDNKTQRNKLEKLHGCRYSVLLKLSYFDIIRMCIIDPMHNLFLGSAKYVMKNIWIEKDILTKHNLKELQENVNAIIVPPDVARIPQKIDSAFSSLTADQLKNWITIYSMPALYGILPQSDIVCWQFFVLACTIICKKTLSMSDIEMVDTLLHKFCCCIEETYGKECTTPNMHMHCHYKDLLLDYGPIHSIWLFSYERYNGILGKQPNNNKSIEVQLMRRFTKDNSVYAYDPMIDLLVLDEMNKLPDEKETKCHSICRRCVLKDCE